MSSSVNRTNNKQLIERIISRCSKLTGLELNIATFPGPQPVAIEKRHFDILNKNEYVVCEKTDGERKILIILYINEKPMCFIVDRNKDYHFIELSFKKELFEGCIFDCELITGTKPSLVIHDCFAYNGVNFTDKPHSMRYYSVLDFIGKRYQYKESDPFKIKTKTFYQYGNRLSETYNHILKNATNEIDGLIFTPVNSPVVFGRMNDLFKWKEINTVDFLVTYEHGTINLNYYNKNNKKTIYSSFNNSDENYSIIDDFIKKTEDNINKLTSKLSKVKITGGGGTSKQNLIIEFKYSLNTKIFTPYRIRSDKNEPNGEITINNTLKNIKESITIDQFQF
jgi:hypothetical protein